jgi:Pyruvate/2-oxoacid:ferredoxin oxidoreductase delta subunit
VTGGLDESTALFEARRCMSCGNCFGCDYCKGCGLCAVECPCGAIEMEPEPS